MGSESTGRLQTGARSSKTCEAGIGMRITSTRGLLVLALGAAEAESQVTTCDTAITGTRTRTGLPSFEIRRVS